MIVSLILKKLCWLQVTICHGLNIFYQKICNGCLSTSPEMNK